MLKESVSRPDSSSPAMLSWSRSARHCWGIVSPARAETRARMASSIERIARHVRAAKGFLGPDVRLVVLPEYFLTGYPLGETIPEWADKAALAPVGPEYEALGRIASDNNVYLAGNAYETDAAFPDFYFQTSFVVAPSGEVALRYAQSQQAQQC